VNHVSRPGLLKLIARSSKPQAKAFDRWVRHEVLAQIMDNGGYVTADADMAKAAAVATANTRLLVVQIVHGEATARVRVEPNPEIEMVVGDIHAVPIEVGDDVAVVQQAAQVLRVDVERGPKFSLG
jgi:prophage antirepressor-like protein